MKAHPDIMISLKILCGLVLVCAVCIGVLGFFLYPIMEDTRCDNKGGDMNLPTRYTFSEGCMFLIDNIWVPESKVQFPPHK